MKTPHRFSALCTAALLALAGSALTGCAATSHPTATASLGVASKSTSMEAVLDTPGPVHVETVSAATWEVDRSGLVDLHDPKAKEAGLVDGREPIELFVHVVRHPEKGVYLVDSGVERAFVADADHALVSGFVGQAAHVDRLVVHRDTESLFTSVDGPVQGVFLTHLHLDHVLGLRDLPASVPIFVGAGDAEDTSFMNVFQRAIYDAALAGKGPLHELRFARDPDGRFEGLLDVFGDQSFWAIFVPGHTPGSIAFLARTPDGPVLLTGDACHTAWGWRHGVAPGTFSDDVAKSADSLARLEALVARHPRIDVRLGHQSLSPAAPDASKEVARAAR